MESLLEPVNIYVGATSFWYFTRALARLYQPEVVYDWFRAGTRLPNEVEIYNIRTDALGLALCAVLVFLIPHLPVSSSGTAKPGFPASLIAAPKGSAVLASVLQHLGTAYYAALQWADPQTSTGAMLLGWTVSAALAVLGIFALATDGVPTPAQRRAAQANKSK